MSAVLPSGYFRIIFASLTKMGKFIPNYHALQIAGRAGRYGTQYEDGEVRIVYYF